MQAPAENSTHDNSDSNAIREREQAAESMAALLIAEEAAEHQSKQSKKATKRKKRNRQAILWAPHLMVSLRVTSNQDHVDHALVSCRKFMKTVFLLTSVFVIPVMHVFEYCESIEP